VLFSLALPLYVLYSRAKVPAWLKLLTLVAMTWWGSTTDADYLFYLPMFAIGAVIVVHWDFLAAVAERVNRRRGTWPVILLIAVVLTCSRWELIGLGMTHSAAARQSWIGVLGVTIFVLAAAFCAPVRAWLQHWLVQWLGALSFSLYLVHEPIIIAVRFLTVDHSPWWGMLISVPLALLVAVAFARVVEKPLQRLARLAGRRMDALRS
jgi:peptidoglycan/LPS O-acetylase OafA/YrhL